MTTNPFTLSLNPAAFHFFYPPLEITTWLYLLSNGFLPVGPFQTPGPPSRPLLLAGSKMELLGEACGIWDLPPLPGGNAGSLLPSAQLSWVAEWFCRLL